MNKFASDELDVLRSKDVAKLTGTTVRALRHYMQLGLLGEPPRDINGYRRFDVTDVVQVLRIRQLSDSGMSLEQIATTLKEKGSLSDKDLDELDQELARKEAQVVAQREALKRLRESMAETRSASLPSKTAQLDADINLLVTGTDQIDPDVLRQVHTVMSAPEHELSATEWMGAFERLEDQDEIADGDAEALVTEITNFYHSVSAQMGSVPAPRDGTLMNLVDELRSAHLSPAQSKVWDLFIERIHPNDIEDASDSGMDEP
ncbi:helix-turn-helix domain-containing protein [Micrococcaceae sp. AOP34-BR2-30]|uniref:helix-turn-helix domain-containing protein n=1 Tax=Flaviflexus sp. TaxID=1969482 RepID=UPI003F9033A9